MAMALITCHFNPCGYQKPVENYYRFRDAINRPMTVVELSFDGRFIESDSIRIHGDLEKNCLWQKERLLNIALDSLPDKFDKVAWLDADFIFLNPDWYEQAEAALEKYDAVQLAGTLHHLDHQGRIETSIHSYGWKHINRPGDGGYYHPGGCWAARREHLKAGFYDKDILGGSDSAQLWAWCNDNSVENIFHRGKAFDEEQYFDWVSKQTVSQIGYVEGDACHLYHGTIEDRNYNGKYNVLDVGNFDFDDVLINESEIWEWAPTDDPQKIAMQNAMRKYFFRRNEDR